MSSFITILLTATIKIYIYIYIFLKAYLKSLELIHVNTSESICKNKQPKISIKCQEQK